MQKQQSSCSNIPLHVNLPLTQKQVPFEGCSITTKGVFPLLLFSTLHCQSICSKTLAIRDLEPASNLTGSALGLPHTPIKAAQFSFKAICWSALGKILPALAYPLSSNTGSCPQASEEICIPKMHLMKQKGDMAGPFVDTISNSRCAVRPRAGSASSLWKEGAHLYVSAVCSRP